MIEKRGRVPGIDIARMFCACLVVMIHCTVVEGHPVAHMIVSCFSKQAVPFFFIVSGFFFLDRLRRQDRKTAVRSFAKKNLMLYFTWVMLWMPGIVQTYNGLYPDASFLYRAMLIVRRIFLAGEGVYWYLLVLAQSTVIAGMLIKREKVLYVASIAGLVLGWCYEWEISWGVLGKINQAVYVLFSWSNNVVMKGLPYFTVGLLFAQYRERLNVAGKWLVTGYCGVSLLHVVFFGVIYCLDASLERFMITYSVQAVLLFWICVQWDGKLSERLCVALRDISSVIYFTHTFFIYEIVDPVFGCGTGTLLRFGVPVALGIVAYCAARKWRIRPMCWLFSMKI